MASDVILWPFDFLIAWQYFQQYLPLSCSGGVPNEVNKDRLDKRESGLPLLLFCFWNPNSRNPTTTVYPVIAGFLEVSFVHDNVSHSWFLPWSSHTVPPACSQTAASRLCSQMADYRRGMVPWYSLGIWIQKLWGYQGVLRGASWHH